MPTLETGTFRSARGLDPSSPDSWTLVRQSPRFDVTAITPLLDLLAEGWVMCSALDVTPAPVIGLRRDVLGQTAFAISVVDIHHLRLELLADAGHQADVTRLLMAWHMAHTGGRTIVGDRTVDLDRFLKSAGDVSGDLPAFPRFEGSPRARLAIRHADARQRLRLSLTALAMVERSIGLPSLLVDNTTVVDGELAHVVGLAPSHRHSAPNWTVWSVTDDGRAAEELRQATTFVDAHKREADPKRTVPPRTAPGSVPTKPAAKAVRVDPEKRASEALQRLEPQPSEAVLADVFHGLSHATPAGIRQPGDAVDPEFQAHLIRSNSRMLAAVIAAMPEYLATLERAAIDVRLTCLALMAQPLYDRLRRHSDDQLTVLLDRSLQSALEALATEPVNPDNVDRIVAACDAIGEIETSSPRLDNALLDAAVSARLRVRRPTLDGLLRLWPAAMTSADTIALPGVGRFAADPRVAGLSMVAATDARATGSTDGRLVGAVPKSGLVVVDSLNTWIASQSHTVQ